MIVEGAAGLARLMDVLMPLMTAVLNTLNASKRRLSFRFSPNTLKLR